MDPRAGTPGGMTAWKPEKLPRKGTEALFRGSFTMSCRQASSKIRTAVP